MSTCVSFNDNIPLSFDNSTKQFTLYANIDVNKMLDEKKIIKMCVEHMFSSNPSLLHPNTLCDKKTLIDAIQINIHSQHISLLLSLCTKFSYYIYKFKIIGISSPDKNIYCIGTSRQTFGDIVKLIKK